MPACRDPPAAGEDPAQGSLLPQEGGCLWPLGGQGRRRRPGGACLGVPLLLRKAPAGPPFPYCPLPSGQHCLPHCLRRTCSLPRLSPQRLPRVAAAWPPLSPAPGTAGQEGSGYCVLLSREDVSVAGGGGAQQLPTQAPRGLFHLVDSSALAGFLPLPSSVWFDGQSAGEALEGGLSVLCLLSACRARSRV